MYLERKRSFHLQLNPPPGLKSLNCRPMLTSFLVVDIVFFFPLQIPPLYLANFVHGDCAELKTLPHLPLHLEMAR